jgi:hypothetical protein
LRPYPAVQGSGLVGFYREIGGVGSCSQVAGTHSHSMGVGLVFPSGRHPFAFEGVGIEHFNAFIPLVADPGR